MTSTARSFGIGLACLGALAFGLRLWIALHAWFETDDFYFLHWVQNRHWDWVEVFLPTYPRGLVQAYRPIGLDTYFYLNFALFGWHAFGYYASAFVLQTATAAVVYRIARQEGYEARVAWVVAFVTWTGGPALIASYAVAEHNYLCAALFYALGVTWFLDWLRTRRVRYQFAACFALLLAMLSNDVGMTLAVLVFVLAFLRAKPNAADGALDAAHGLGLWTANVADRARQAVTGSWPQLVSLLLFVDFRAWGVPMRQRGWFYQVDLGFDMLPNTLGNLAYAAGGDVRLMILAALSIGALLALWRQGEAPAARRALGACWLALGVLPFAVLAFPATRFALAIMPAMALCTGAVASALLQRVRSPRRQHALLLGLVCLCVPWEDAVERVMHPRSAQQQQAFALALSTLPGEQRTCLTVLCGGPGLANTADCVRFRDLTFGGDLFRAVVPLRELDVEFEDARLDMSAYSPLAGRDCVTYELRDDKRLVASTRHTPPQDAELSQVH